MLPGGITRDVFVVDGRFTFVPQSEARTVIRDAYLVPGLVDAHAHLALASPARNAPPREAAEASARAHLNAGVLVVREPGGPSRASSGIGPAQGLPRVQTAGHFLAPVGGYFPGLAREIAVGELPEAALDEARASGAWVKAIGDFPDEDGHFRAHWPVAVLKEAVDAVHAAGARFAVHAVGTEAIDAALAAGVDTLEHGIMASAEHVSAMRRGGTSWCPTLDIIPLVTGAFEGFLVEDEQSRFERALRELPRRVREAHDAGVRVLAGTDAGMLPHGAVRNEIRLLRDAGLPPDAALGAGSWDARNYLGLPGIEEGAPADVVAFRDDPRDPAVLSRVAAIVLDGRQIRSATDTSARSADI